MAVSFESVVLKLNEKIAYFEQLSDVQKAQIDQTQKLPHFMIKIAQKIIFISNKTEFLLRLNYQK